MQYNNFDKMFPILIMEINKNNESQNDNSYGIHPSPQPNNREIIEAYNDLKYSGNQMCIIKLSQTYCIYMVYYIGKYWIVPYSTIGFNFQIKEYINEDYYSSDCINDIFFTSHDMTIENIEKGQNIHNFDRDIDFNDGTVSTYRVRRIFFDVYTRLKKLFI